MKAVTFEAPGDESVLLISEVESPSIAAGRVRIEVRAAGVNRADLLQRRGLYPPPPGASPILGLECAGVVAEVGHGVSGWRTGDRVMALLAGGGYAQEVVVDSGSLMRIPEAMSFEEAGGFPETFITAFLNLFVLGRARRGTSVLVHGGSGGVGTSAIALCRAAGIRIFVTAGGDDRCRRCEELGAERAFNHRTEDFAEAISGLSVIVDPVGGDYLERNLKVLGPGGRLIVIGSMKGTTPRIDLRTMLAKRLHLIGSTLRNRTPEDKAAIISQFVDEFGHALSAGSLRPVLDRSIPLERAAEAHRLMAEGGHFGKIVLTVS